MSVGIESQVTSPEFQDANKIGIAQLSPDARLVEQAHIEANVALVWPYSSSTRTLSLLLVEKDVRLRASKGQVKVTFYGSCARRVAEIRIGIGATVKLGLEAVQWTRTGEFVSTPGKKVDWDINISQQVHLEARFPDDRLVVVNLTAEPQTSVVAEAFGISTDTPPINGVVDIRKTRLLASHNSPARKKSDRISSGSFIDASLDPFADDDGYIVGRGRKRTKFARHSGTWQFVDGDEEILTEIEQQVPSSPLQHRTDKGDVVSTFDATDGDVDQIAKGVEQRPDLPIVSLITTSSSGIELEPEPEPESTSRDVVDDQTVPVLGDKMHTPEPASTLMGPPPLPLPTTPEMQSRPFIEIPDHPLLMPTPVLRPILSPGLALVSPLVERSGLMTSYFPSVIGSQNELDAASHVATAPQSSVASPSVHSEYNTIQDVHEHEQVQDLDGIEVEDTSEPHAEELVSDDLQSDEAQQDQNDRTSSPSPVKAQQRVGTVIRSEEALMSPDQLLAGVDLDALQQHIDESSRLLQDDTSQVHRDDGDMYDPPVRTQRDNVEKNTVDIPSGSTEVDQASVGSEQLASAQLPVIVDISSDEEEDSEDETSSNHVSDEDDVDEESNDRDDDLKHDTISQAGFLEAISATADSDMHTVNITNNIIPSFSQEPPVNGFATDMPAELSKERYMRQSDGTVEAFESEELRNQLRTDIAALDASNDASAAILLNTSLSPELPKQREDEMEGHPNGRLEQASALSDFLDGDMRRKHLNQVDNPVVESSEAVFINDSSAEVFSTTSTHTESFDVPLPSIKRGGKESMLTPDATQQRQAFTDNETQPNFILPPVLPLSPRLTQQETTQAVTTSADMEALDEVVKEERSEEQLPMQLQVEDKPSKPLPRPPQRLSRKSFTGEKIVTEYFTPRRSSRIIQSSPTRSSHQTPIVQPPTSPPRSKRVLRSSSPMMTQELAQETVPTIADLGGTTTQLSYFPSFSSLTQYFGSDVDVIGVCSANPTPPQKAKAGPRDYHTSLYLTDPSFSESKTTLVVQIFRPRKNALPVMERGDIILLRNVKVQTSNHQAMLTSTDSSAWAVFKNGSGQASQVTINGPPLEYGEAEKVRVAELLKWWQQEGQEKYSEHPTTTTGLDNLANRRSTSPRVTRSHARKISASEHNIGQVEDNPPTGQKPTRTRQRASSQADAASDHESVATRNPSSPVVATRKYRHQRNNSERSNSVVHELRDGTQYTDESGGRQRSTSVIHELRDGSTYVDE